MHVNNPAVRLDGRRLRMGRDELEQEHVLAIEGVGELMVLLQMHRPDMGQACEITTGAPMQLSPVKVTGVLSCQGFSIPHAVGSHRCHMSEAPLEM